MFNISIENEDCIGNLLKLDSTYKSLDRYDSLQFQIQ